MSVKPDVAESVKTRTEPKVDQAPQLAPFRFDSAKAKAAAAKSHESRRAKRDAIASGPREAIAMGLMDKLSALRIAAGLLAEDCASTDAAVRKQARRDIGPWLNQALGTIERRSDVTPSEGDTLPADRETRMRLLAELDALSGD